MNLLTRAKENAAILKESRKKTKNLRCSLSCSGFKNLGGVLKSMLTLNEAIIDVKES
ncbi:hypothetical protein KTJ53_11925 [Acinetobacter variabilis]|uniref:hypothetical protein n=1 Tax=Acinetobacter variabilis TaxID=70346 RepID=UPI0021D312C2|nr:hypothetical protein [Acinetobacter variabilis]MCU4630384.1 hypothetical protein [Acinetobacter variabilis]